MGLNNCTDAFMDKHERNERTKLEGIKDLIMKSVMVKINNIAKFEAEDEFGSRRNNKN